MPPDASPAAPKPAVAAEAVLPAGPAAAAIHRLRAARHGVVGAVAGVGPAVMQGPHHGQVVLPEPGKEHGEIEVIPVQVVQVHEVGLVRLQLADEPAGGVAAEKARAVGKPGQGQVQQRFRLAADDIAGHVGGRVIARMADEGAVTGLHGRAAQGNRDAPRAQRGDDIDLGDAHAGAPFMRRGKMAAYSVSRSAGNGKGTKKRRPAKPGGRRRLTRGGAQGDHRLLHHSRFPAFRKYRRCARWPRAERRYLRGQRNHARDRQGSAND